MGIRTSYCFDSDLFVQTTLLAHFPKDEVVFASYPKPGVVSLHTPSPMQPPDSSESFLVEIEAEALNVADLVEGMPWILRANVILIRTTLGYFWSGRGDLRNIVQWWGNRHFAFVEVLDFLGVNRLDAQLGRVILAFERNGALTWKKVDQGDGKMSRETSAAVARIHRCNEALAYLSQPIARVENLTRLSGRGSFGFSAGVINPGVKPNGSGFTFLARGEKVPWAIAEQNQSVFLTGCRALMMKIDDQLTLRAVREVVINRPNGMEGVRFEDFRIFQYQRQLFSNHACVSNPGVNPSAARRLQPALLRVNVGISRWDLARNELTYLGAPKLDRLLGLIEKNWVFFEHQEQLYLLYSFKPYHLLRANRWPRLDFETMFNRDFSFPLSEDGIPIRNSANPVEYDSEHFIHVIHKVYPEKRYAFWAILIDKRTLIPKMITDRPLACGWHSAPASIIYICALIPRESEVLLFGGIDDSSIGIWRIPRSRLDSHWVTLLED